ncbi:hypothetical protein [Streptomyces nigra]|uniref:hypothetical protein n=1 Tax=Streptomyces nigra TaxID=1827580 RepID=UPI0030D1CE36
MVALSGAGMSGVFLFLTSYVQSVLGFTPVQTGSAFLPLIGVLMVVAQVSLSVLIPRLGPKTVVPAGMVMAAARPPC